MQNVCVLVGTGYFGEDVLSKSNWFKNLGETCSLFTISRIDPRVHLDHYTKYLLDGDTRQKIINHIELMRSFSTNYVFIYDSEAFNSPISSNQIASLETWLGIPFKLLVSFNRRFYEVSNGQSKFNTFDVHEYVAKLTLFYRRFFQKNNVTVLINTLEDDLFSTVAFYVAKKMGIRFLSMQNSRFKEEGVMFGEDFGEIVLLPPQDSDTSSYELSNSLIRDDIRVSNKGKYNFSFRRIISGILYYATFPMFKKTVQKAYPGEKFIIQDTSFLTFVMGYMKRLYRYYFNKRLFESPNSDEKFVLFPMHYFDDAQLTFRDPFLDQYDVIRCLSRVLPHDYYLYVKIHPHYFSTDNSHSELRLLSGIDNVRIIGPEWLTPNLLQDAKSVFTINSTVGFEALMHGVPLVTIGHEFYSNDSICRVVRDYNDLTTCIMNSINDAGDVNDKIDQFIQSIYESTIFINKERDKNGIVYIDEENSKSISSKLLYILGCSIAD